MTAHFATVALALCILAPLGAQDAPQDAGPTSLVIRYRCYPSHRNQLRHSMTDRGLAQLEDWKTHGILGDYQVLFSRYVDTGAWDMLALLHFRKYEDVARWKFVERRAVAALPGDAAEWLSEIETFPADEVRLKVAHPAPEHAVYMVIPYTVSVPSQNFLQFVDNYDCPRLDGWVQEGILTGYSFYMQRYPAARPWDSLLVLEFKDDLSLGAREKIAEQVRQNLGLNADERNVRVEQATVIADDLARDR